MLPLLSGKLLARAGVSKPVLYYYFQSKEGLYYAILKWGAEVQKKIIDDVFEASGTVQDRIIFLYRRIYEEIQAYQGLYTMIHGLIYGPPQGAPDMISQFTTVRCSTLLNGYVSRACHREKSKKPMRMRLRFWCSA